MHIKILGTGCSRCKTLEKLVNEVVAENNLNAEVSKVEDIVQIMNYGIFATPGLVVDKEVLLSGRLPSKNEIVKLLTTKAYG
ncbi:MAG: thioredoxin family protein [Bacteroidales bacterium]|jgi:small redox-active disulfide protein 2|nr:thioredoxin family protein [Bacteroidales bacterium]MDD3700862.1 thioredoxin family protein [Bacteroidales bacterium]MDY0369841.1 thioredoxin family protein [Bacteroidales bacterium]